MNDKKRSFRQKAEDFLSGRGFYIALSACVLVIAIAAWTLLSSGDIADRTDVAEDITASGNVAVKDEVGKTDTAEMIDKMDQISQNDEADAEVNAEIKVPDDTQVSVPDEAPAVETIAPAPETPEPLKFAWPVSGAVEVGYFADELVYNKTMMDWRTHSALDIGADLGTKVLSCANGTVSEVYEDALLGTVVVIDHGEGLQSIYANLAAAPTVSVGDAVTISSVIGSVGDTAICETSQPYHLHFAMKQNGKSVDPTEYLP